MLLISDQHSVVGVISRMPCAAADQRALLLAVQFKNIYQFGITFSLINGVIDHRKRYALIPI